MTVEMTSWKWHSGEFSLAEGRMGWNEERAAWGSPVPSLKFRQGVVRPTLTPIPHQALDGRRGRGERKKWKCILGRKNLQELVLYWLKQRKATNPR